MRRWIGSAVVALGLVAAAGCGGGDAGNALSQEEYQAEVVAAGQQVAAQFEEIAAQAQSLSTADIGSLDDAAVAFQDLADVVASGETELRSFADRLAALEPPEDAQAANAKLVAGFRQLADDFGALGAALEDGEISQITQLGEQLESVVTSEAGRTIGDAIEELESAGYSFETED